jgi:hypothetical protein
MGRDKESPEMTHRSTAGHRAKRFTLSLLASALLLVASPVVAPGSASAGGAHKQVGASFGDCKNDNRGKHNGYVCPTPDNGGGDDGGEVLVDY